MATIALADDHKMFRNGLVSMMQKFGHEVLHEANDGAGLIALLEKGPEPDLVLMDINMKVKDGYETCLHLKTHFPAIKVLALSMYDDEESVIRMIRNGARGYVLKEAEPEELKEAIAAVLLKGFYYSEMVTGRLIHSIAGGTEENNELKKFLALSERETEFLKLVCTEMGYKEIAAQMHLSPRTIDGYRDGLFEKLNIKSRTGLVLYAIRHGIVKI